jgi:hypothetical protein
MAVLGEYGRLRWNAAQAQAEAEVARRPSCYCDQHTLQSEYVCEETPHT